MNWNKYMQLSGQSKLSFEAYKNHYKSSLVYFGLSMYKDMTPPG